MPSFTPAPARPPHLGRRVTRIMAGEVRVEDGPALRGHEIL
ncbi:hypothetical protein [Deinococcus aerolatus]|nr:hypothetical protein [Deinococcus aerolatus]